MNIFENDIVKLTYNKELFKIFIYLKNATVYSLEVLDGLFQIVDPIHHIVATQKVDCIVSISEDITTWGVGGDLEYFFHCIQNDKKNELYEYAHKCVELVYLNNCGFRTGIPTASIIGGRTFGGGFESALSSNILLSRPRVKANFPEVKFGSFPGMGAYSLLTRKFGFSRADEMIGEGKSYNAQELLALNLIDAIVDFNTETELCDSLNELVAKYNADPLKQIYFSISKDELIKGTNLWVEQMFALSKNDTNKIYRIFNVQKERIVPA